MAEVTTGAVEFDGGGGGEKWEVEDK